MARRSSTADADKSRGAQGRRIVGYVLAVGTTISARTVCNDLGVSSGAVVKALERAGHGDQATPFRALRNAEYRALRPARRSDATCPRCDRVCALDASGRLRVHGPRTARCPGSRTQLSGSTRVLARRVAVVSLPP